MRTFDDDQLVEHLLDGDNSAHNALLIIYKENYPKVRHMIVQKGGQEADAKDVFQESVIALHKMIKEKRFRKEARIDTVIYAIARNLWYQKLRKTRFSEDLTTLKETKTELSTEIELNWDKVSIEKKMSQMVAELGSDCQKIIRMFYYERFSMLDIQSSFGLSSVQAAKNKKYRCMKSLMEIFKTHGVKPDSF